MYRFDTTGQMTMRDLDTAERGGAPSKRKMCIRDRHHPCD